MRHECYFCQIKATEKLIKKFQPDQETINRFLKGTHEQILRHWENPTPQLAASVHRLLKKELGITDLYKQEKDAANNTLLNRYEHWENLANTSINPFHTAARLAVIGNIIDYGAHSVPEDLNAEINRLLQHKLAIDHSKELSCEITKAKNILYLGDNTGEIVFDRLFIEKINHPNVIFAVKDAPVLNDVTLEDAQNVGLTKVCKAISNGYDAPSTILDKCSDDFKNVYQQADLIISKGQGNFEGLMNEKDPRLFFMLMAKCDPIARLLKVRKGDMVILQNKLR